MEHYIIETDHLTPYYKGDNGGIADDGHICFTHKVEFTDNFYDTPILNYEEATIVKEYLERYVWKCKIKERAELIEEGKIHNRFEILDIR